jgi:hypothetical protein
MLVDLLLPLGPALPPLAFCGWGNHAVLLVSIDTEKLFSYVHHKRDTCWGAPHATARLHPWAADELDRRRRSGGVRSGYRSSTVNNWESAGSAGGYRPDPATKSVVTHGKTGNDRL